jgi:hypothetical protein
MVRSISVMRNALARRFARKGREVADRLRRVAFEAGRNIFCSPDFQWDDFETDCTGGIRPEHDAWRQS